MAAMAGGTQLFEGAHLTGGNMRFRRESSKCRNFALLLRIQLCRDYALFEGHFWPKFGDGGH